MRFLPPAFLAANALLHLYFGVVFMLDPVPMMESLSIAATSPAGLVEMRTFYGGLMTALGLLFLSGAVWRAAARPALVMMSVTYAAAVLARSVGLVVEQVDDPLLLQILGIEATGLVMGLVGLRLLARETRG